MSQCLKTGQVLLRTFKWTLGEKTISETKAPEDTHPGASQALSPAASRAPGAQAPGATAKPTRRISPERDSSIGPITQTREVMRTITLATWNAQDWFITPTLQEGITPATREST